MARESTKGKTARKTPKESASGSENQGIKKQYLKSGACKVTFKLPKEAASEANVVAIVGDFNDWSIEANQMKKQKNGNFTITLELQPGREYRYKYLIDGPTWENDWNADRYEQNAYGTDDSIVAV
ncbi:MAG TPA: isoamylase early set domain-containing protein [Thermodesulfobacteriota bacterium]|nr:isoamylase early set domain-containing protein [Thermodesulfobacteriota bacterium]